MTDKAKDRGTHATCVAIFLLSLVNVLLDGCNSSSDSGGPVGGNGLWIANGANVIEFLPRDLSGGTSAAAPHLVIKSMALGGPRGVTFDATGDLWVLDTKSPMNGAAAPALLKFSVTQVSELAAHADPEPVATITSSNLTSPQQSVFDVQGNQWITDHNSNTVVVFTASELAQTGANFLVPAIVISSASFNGPSGIAFDNAGNLWVSNSGAVPGSSGTASAPGTTIVEFKSANLPATIDNEIVTADLTPDVMLGDDGHSSIEGPWALAFDALGNLWASNSVSPSTLVEFSQATLATTGMPTPAVTLSPAAVNGDPTLNEPNGICVDDVGNLAAANSAGAFGVPVFGPGQLATGAPIPATFLVGAATTLKAPAGCVFGPVIT